MVNINAIISLLNILNTRSNKTLLVILLNMCLQGSSKMLDAVIVTNA